MGGEWRAPDGAVETLDLIRVIVRRNAAKLEDI